MLKLLFAWFDAHPQSYWVITAIPTLLLVAWSAFLLRREPDPVKPGSKRHEALFALLLLAVLVAWRWPFLLSADEYNPDESQLIAGALTLRIDPVPWRSVDGFTSGPLNFYPLLLPHAFGLPLDYFTARLTALLLIWGALLACYHLFRSWFSVTFARLGIMPALAFFCTVTDGDFVHYSSEHLSLFLVALSACCLSRSYSREEEKKRWQLIGGFVAGLLPWAKLQSGPLAAVLIMAALISVARAQGGSRKTKLRAGALLILAAAMPSLLILAIVIASGQFEHFTRSYVLQNFVYVGDGTSLFETLRDLWQAGLRSKSFPFFLVISLAGIVASSIPVRKTTGIGPSWFLGLALFVTSVVCILTPRRALLHYVLLSIVPLTIWFGTSLGRRGNSLKKGGRAGWGFSALAAGILVPFGLRITQPVPEIFGSFLVHWREPRTVLGNVIRACASPESRLAIWGWLPSLYVESGLPQGTRDGNSSWAMMESPYRQYYMQRFLADMQRNQPDLFVDAVGAGGRFFSDREHAGHENFPALAEYVRQHYRLVTDAGYARLYAKSDSRIFRPDNRAELSFLKSGSDAAAFDAAMHRESMSPPDLPQWQLKTGSVQMLAPPAEVAWSLDESTREISFDYGFAPEAYRTARTDGAALIFELHSEGVPVRHLFYRFLDPVHRPADRGPVTDRLVLPPFKPGARLILRTTAGPSGSTTGGWLYLRHVIPIILPTYSPAQFPSFNRVPDAADAEFSYLLEEQGETILILHAPAFLTYHLNGKERRLRFDYGFRSGAYSNGGQTDGATFQVELQRNQGSPQILFQSELNPTGKAEDRGSHSADFLIPPGNEGTKLIIRVDPGKGNAWDWTYITNFTLE